MRCCILLVLPCLQMICCSIASAAIIDFTNWTLVEDPADPNFSGSATSSIATLRASNGTIPVGHDIGFQSVNGQNVATSTSGYYFDTGADFMVAIDYSLSLTNGPLGNLGLGFGIGEDGAGMNSAGVGIATSNGSPRLTFAGAARVKNMNQTPVFLSLPSSLSGSMFVEYEASTGNVSIGAATTPGATMPTASDSFAPGLQNQWNGDNLLISYFIRSDLAGWQGGSADAVFSNFRVLEGSATAVPEPFAPAAVMLCAAFLSSFARRRNRPGSLLPART